MRRHVVVLLLALLSLGAWASAQTDASHQVTVRIPTVLRLGLGDDTAAARAEVPLRVEVQDGRYVIDPARTRLEILANSGWQLSASFRPAAGQPVPLQLGIAGAWHDARPYPSVLLEGAATRGVRTVDVDYGLRSLPADGTYHGVVTYTLARP